jgi:hypothetical protein
MPVEARHLEQAASNERFLQTIDRDAFPDWAITAFFYTSLHYVDACLSLKNIHPPNHSARENILRNHADLIDLIDGYVYLRNASRRSRYDCRRPHPLDLQTSEDQSGTVKAVALKKLGPSRP